MIYPQPQKPRRVKGERQESSVLESIATRLANALVRQRFGNLCVACGKRKATEIAHGFPKGAYPSVQFDGVNLFPLCHQCHSAFGSTSPVWYAWVESYLGTVIFEALRDRANKPRRPLEEIVSGLRAGKFSNELEAA
jgi:hypothetical protein